jgi:outer membrane protein
MSGASRFGIVALIALLAVSPAAAADLAAPVEPTPPPPPTVYVHAGALGAFANPNAQPTGGGLFVGLSNIAIRPVYTLVLETGYYVTPNFAITLATAVPPITHFKATGLAPLPPPTGGMFGTDLLGSARYGELALLLQYWFTQFGPLQPYVGAGGGFALNFGNISDGILRNFYWDQNFAFIAQAGFDYMFTPNWGVFVDGKKVWFATDAGGLTTTGLVPVRAHVRVDPWVADVGITFKY